MLLALLLFLLVERALSWLNKLVDLAKHTCCVLLRLLPPLLKNLLTKK